jgi:lysophospholipase L1-like esterase
MNSKLRSGLSGALFVLLIFLSIEAACEVAYRVYKGSWYFKDRRTSERGMVQPHPYFGACLIPNVTDERNGVRITHNSFRTRGPEFSRPRQDGRIRIVALGGSATYCVSVSDNETWEYFLNQRLGTNYEVINMGAPGGTSVETMIQSALLFSDVQPEIAIYYLGWNDARVQHVKDLWPDWSDSHGKWVMGMAMGGKDLQPHTAAGYILRRIAFHYFFPKKDSEKIMSGLKGTPDAFTDRIDQRALGHYERNLKLIAAVCRKQGVRPVFVPQILNYKVLTSDKPYGWLPFVRDRDLKKVMAAYNETVAKVAQQENIGYASEVLHLNYGDADFVDNGHFSPVGNERFAGALADALERTSAQNMQANSPPNR